MNKVELKSDTNVKSVEVVDVNSNLSTKKGVGNIVENFVRQFQIVGFLVFLLPITLLYVLCIGVTLTPAIYTFQIIAKYVAHETAFIQALGYGLGVGVGFVLIVISLVIIVPIFNLPIRPFVKSYRGAWFSLEAIPWYYHNALTYLVRYTILDFITPSPLNILFFRLMGMKIGKGVVINTSNISDPCLIQLDDYVTIGGSVYMMAHYGMKGFLVIDKLHLKKGAMIGLGAKILGGVTIEEKATVLPNSAVLPKTVITSGAKYGVVSDYH